MSDKYYLGFDAGTQSVKVAVYDEDQHCLAMDTAKTHLAYPQPGWVQMDVDEYYRLIKQCMASCSRQMEEKGWDVKNVRAIMGDGIICGIAGIDADGNAITPYVNYLDSRTADDVEALKAQKLAIWGKETGNAEPNIMFPAMFARWFMKNVPAWQEKGVKFVHNCPYVLMHLAGLKGEDAFIDWGAMSGWGLGYDVVQKKWSPEQLDILGIPERYMPRIVKPWDIIGRLCEEDAMETGFPAGIPICAGAGDTMESMMGSGILEAGRAVDVAAPSTSPGRAPCSAPPRTASFRNCPCRGATSSSIPVPCRGRISTGAWSAQAAWPCAGSRTALPAKKAMTTTGPWTNWPGAISPAATGPCSFPT